MSALIKNAHNSSSQSLIHNKFGGRSSNKPNSQLINFFADTMKLMIDQNEKFDDN